MSSPKAKLLALLLATLTGTSALAAGNFFCCNDASGKQVCGDILPQACYGRAYRELGSNGQTIRTVDAPLTAEQRSQLDWTLAAKAGGWQWQPAGAPSREVREVSGQLTLAGVDAIAADSLVNWLAQGAQPALQGILSAQLLARYGLRMQLDNLSLRYNGSQLGGRGRLQLQADPIPLLSVGQLRKRLQGEGQWQAEASLAAQPGFEWLAGALQQGTVQQMEKQLEAPWQIKRGKLTVNGQRVEGVLPF